MSYNYTRLKECMKRAQAGEELTLGFFGGSITQGSLSSSDELMYAYRVFQWWEKTFPQAKFHYVNGGIGGTSSHFGVARVVDNLLMYQPDFAVIDFSVNDDEKEGEFFQETYEGVLRKVLNWQSKPAVVLLNNVYYDTGINAQEFHNAVGDYYGVPHVSIKDTVYQKVKSGEINRQDITPDNLHPNDAGHALVADEICKLLEEVKNMEVEPVAEEEKAPMTANAYENAQRLTIANATPELKGFRADAEEKKGHLDVFKNGWIASKEGDKIIFEVEASCIAVQYRKTITQPAPVAKVTVDGENEVILDSNFDETWGDCLYLQPVMHHGEKKLHRVEIEITKAGEDIKNVFYLLSLIIA